jgi:hypothetical protein
MQTVAICRKLSVVLRSEVLFTDQMQQTVDHSYDELLTASRIFASSRYTVHPLVGLLQRTASENVQAADERAIGCCGDWKASAQAASHAGETDQSSDQSTTGKLQNATTDSFIRDTDGGMCELRLEKLTDNVNTKLPVSSAGE